MNVAGFDVSETQWAAIKMMRERGHCYIATPICHGSSLRALERSGLVEKSSLPGWWSLTDLGKTGDVQHTKYSKRRMVNSTQYVSYEPPAHVKRRLLEAKEECKQLRPRQKIFNRLVRESAVDFLGRKKIQGRLIFFAYPMGFPLKHIAWALREESPLITEVEISNYRWNMAMPARSKTFVKPRPIVDQQMFRQLLDEGCTEEEIFEYFAAVGTGEAVF